MSKNLKFKDVVELERKIQDYFIEMKQQNRPYTITGLALYLDTTRQTLLEYEGEVEGRDGKDPVYADTIKRAKLRCENFVEEGMLTNQLNSTASIFNMKNNYGWKDRNETDLTTQGDKIKAVNIIHYGKQEIKDVDSNGNNTTV